MESPLNQARVKFNTFYPFKAIVTRFPEHPIPIRRKVKADSNNPMIAKVLRTRRNGVRELRMLDIRRSALAKKLK